ncbi:MAG: hypothetical protein IH914_11210, partial [candidate division Zixibacteria bacterium]|nr:hypothetical protein [candidate division Zixibacteria bacterium]
MNKHIFVVAPIRSACRSLSTALLVVAALSASAGTANAQSPCHHCSDFVSGSDTNCYSVSLTIADLALLAKIVSGDTVVANSCFGELDGYQNSFFQCNPNIGDVVEFSRFTTYGFSSVPVFDCATLPHLEASQLELVVSAPMILVGHGPGRYPVRLRNRGPDSAFVWGLTIPLKFKVLGPEPAFFTAAVDSLRPKAKWRTTAVSLDPTRFLISFIPTVASPLASITLGPDEEVEIFDISLHWFAPSETNIIPELFSEHPVAAPLVVRGTTGDPLAPLKTEVLALTLENCCSRRGDVNRDRKFNISDITFMIRVLFGDSLSVDCFGAADINEDLEFNIADVIAAINHIFVKALPPQCTGCISKQHDMYNIVDHGDVNLNGISYEIADLVILGRALLQGTDAFRSDPLSQLGASDIDLDCVPLTTGDYVQLWRVIIGANLPRQPYPVSHFTKVAHLDFIDNV